MGTTNSKSKSSLNIPKVEYSDKLRKITDSVRQGERNKFKDECVRKNIEFNKRVKVGTDTKIQYIKDLIDSGSLEESARRGYYGKRLDSFFDDKELFEIYTNLVKVLPNYKGVKIEFDSDNGHHTLTLWW